jgi:predicted dehydrogenase
LQSHRDLIGRIEAASVVAPASSHYAIARDLIDAGIHVLVEKPLAAEGTEAADLVGRAERVGIVLQVGHIERHTPIFAALRERVTGPRRIAAVRRTGWTGRSADVDVVLDLMIHDIDLILSLTAAPLAGIEASGAVGPSGLVDEAEAWLTFAGGLVATLSASRCAERPLRRLTVTEPASVLTADFGTGSLTAAGRRGASDLETITVPVADSLAAEIDEFLACVRSGERPLVDGKAGLAALRVCDMIRNAIAAPAAARSA